MNALKSFFEQLRNLDARDVGRWPFLFRALAVVLVFVVATGLLVWYFVYSEAQGNIPDLRAAEAEQQSLWATFDQKQRKAANLEAYRQQMVEMEESFGALVSQLPSDTEVPGLLEDITNKGLLNGLEIASIQLQKEAAREFYVELPIAISASGSYHDLGAFISGMAGLPRIVTLHDFTITAKGDDANNLGMSIIAKTYRYKDGEA